MRKASTKIISNKMPTQKNKEDLQGFWCVLLIMGFNINNNYLRQKNIFKSCNISFLILNVSIIFVICSSKYIFKRTSISGSLFNIMFITVLLSIVMLLWSIAKDLRHLKKFRVIMRTFLKVKKTYLEILLIYSLIVPGLGIFIYKMVCLIYFSGELQEKYYKKNFQDLSGIEKIKFSFLCMSLLITQMIPVCVNVVFCAFCQHWKKVISCLAKDIKNVTIKKIFENTLPVPIELLLRKYRDIWRGTILLRKAFSSVTFFLILVQFINIFSCYGMLYTNIPISTKCDFILELIENCIYFIATVYSGARIPEEMERLILNLNELNEDLVFEDEDEKFAKVQKLITVLMNKRPIFLTVGGCFVMKKSLIVGASGSLITYGLIAMQFSSNNILNRY